MSYFFLSSLDRDAYHASNLALALAVESAIYMESSLSQSVESRRALRESLGLRLLSESEESGISKMSSYRLSATVLPLAERGR